MGSRSSYRGSGKSRIADGEKDVVAATAKASYNKSDKVLLRSLISAHIKYEGPISGIMFEWPRAGSVVAVPRSDAEILVQKRLGGKTCCGSDGTRNRIFEVIPN